MPPAPSSPRIVLVEDHLMVRQLFAHVVRQELKFSLVAECTTVAEAREVLRRERPELAIVDWMLPDGRAADLVRELAPGLPGTRWLIISSNENLQPVREAAALGVQGFVMKRSDLPTLRAAVQRVLAGDTFYCPVSARLLAEHVAQPGGTKPLTTREREVLQGFARGESAKEMADRLGTSVKTVQNHLTALKDKLGIREPAELVRYAIKHGFADAP